MKPPFAYYGGKMQLAPRIVDLLPEHGHYVEPFAGGLAVLLAKSRVDWETVNDLDGDLMTFWRVLRDQPDELAQACLLTPHSRVEYLASLDRSEVDDLERARRVWSCLAQGRGRRLRNDGWKFGVNPGGSISVPARLNAFAARLLPAAERLAGVSLECHPAIDVIARYGSHPDVLIYADPPYLGASRNTHSGYGVDMTSEAEHRELAAALRACKATVVLSGYDSPLYAELYDGWHATRFAERRTEANSLRTEVLWSNRPLATPENEQPMTLDLSA